ncbi:hypothetical protein [Puia dinghuensis]|uniref:Uncharacterized protein n=1 Tax=Puia dinghuensis TaxID=1792502 RepID=A0A8J2XVE0_9BACT|nr:hypothetical protein [Puia dinghuensis]GGB17791.1 hypothetical protein GCM10011511_47000 [Puia dinghuensis]
MKQVVKFSDLFGNRGEESYKRIPLLPVCHTTNLEAVRKMLEHEEMRAVEFYEEFNECLLFFFYGRAPYIPEEQLHHRYDRRNPPIGFIFDLESFQRCPQRLVPFDSGGYERYKINLPLKEFLIKPDSVSDEIKMFIWHLFSCNDNYLQKKLTIKPEHYPWCSPIGWLKHLYSFLEDRQAETEFGDQAYTIEIQFVDSLPLTPLFIILPDRFGSTEEAKQQVMSAFHLSGNEYDKKILLYREDRTADVIYNYIVEEVNNKISDIYKNL